MVDPVAMALASHLVQLKLGLTERRGADLSHLNAMELDEAMGFAVGRGVYMVRWAAFGVPTLIFGLSETPFDLTLRAGDLDPKRRAVLAKTLKVLRSLDGPIFLGEIPDFQEPPNAP